MADLPLVVQLNCEIRYSAGFLFYDRSGAALKGLLAELGSPPFAAGAPSPPPSVVFALSSPAEHLSIDFGPERFLVQQIGLETLARVELVAPSAWEIVSDKFEVKRSVTRVGVRLHIMWPAESDEDAETRLLRSGLLGETPRWTEIFGATSKRAYTSIVGNKGSEQARYVLSGGRFVIDGDVPSRLTKFQMPSAISLDVDCFREFEPAGSLPKQALKEFLRESWTRSKELSGKLAGLL